MIELVDPVVRGVEVYRSVCLEDDDVAEVGAMCVLAQLLRDLGPR